MRGRPTKYNDDVINQTCDYFADPQEVAGDRLATIAGLSVYLGVHVDTIYEWKKRHPDFSDAIKLNEGHQVRQLVNIMLDKDQYTTGSIFVAKNILGWKDKTETEVVEMPTLNITLSDISDVSDC